MKISLVQCPGWGRDSPPYTIALLSSILKEEGHRVNSFDLNNTLYLNSPEKYRKFWDNKDLYSSWTDGTFIKEFMEDNREMVQFQIEQILDSGAKLISFTVHFTSLLVSFSIAEMIKEKDDSKFIVFGGPECSLQQKGKFIIEKSFVDAVSVGEGDLLIKNLVHKFTSKEGLCSCKGLLFKHNGKVIENPDYDIVENLNSLPIPDYSDFKQDIEAGLYNQPERLEIFETRGCFVKCHFCSEWQFWKKFRSKSGKRIYKEVTHQMSNFPQVNYFYFLGSILNGDIKALNDFCDLVIENNLDIQWAGQAIIRPEMDKSLVKKMRQAGCRWLSFGIESGSQKVVKGMNKKFSIGTAERVLTNVHEAGIEIQANFMFGMPNEEKDDFEQTLEFLKRNHKNIDTILASQSFCVVDEGTYLYNNAGGFNIRYKDHHLYWETEHGNTYPERFRRYEKFCKLALSLGIPETSGVLEKKPDKWKLLGDYFKYKKKYKKAAINYEKSRKEEKETKKLLLKLRYCYDQLNDVEKVEKYDKLISNYKSKSKYCDKEKFPNTSEVDSSINYENINSLSSAELSRKLNYMKKNIDQINISKIIKSLGFNQEQKWFSNIFYRQKNWDKLFNFILIETQKNRLDSFLYGYPYWLVVDPTNFCNLQCPFCPTGQRREAREKNKLGYKNFKKVIDKLGPYIIHIDFCNWGEPFLNDEIFKMIRYSKQFNIDTKVDTNLHFLNKDKVYELLNSGLDKLIVSIDGASSKTYSRYRKGGDFKRVMKNLKFLLAEKERLGYESPYITWQFLVFRHNEHEIEKVKKVGNKLGVDEVGITKAFIGKKDWIPLNEEYSRYKRKEISATEELTSDYFKYSRKKICNWLWRGMVINPNGSISPCCSVENEEEDFGNFFTHPFEKIWNNQKYREARRYIKQRKNLDKEENVCIGCKHLGMGNVDLSTCESFYNLRSKNGIYQK